jgi:CheY-like chemotaxis protein
VLVVDDNVDAAAVLSALLDGLGHEVQTVHSGIEALAVAETFRPEVILLDLGMPGMDGLEVARRLRERPRNPQPVIVAVTGWGKAEDRVRSKEAGVDVHLVKPVEEDQLRMVLGNDTLH